MNTKKRLTTIIAASVAMLALGCGEGINGDGDGDGDGDVDASQADAFTEIFNSSSFQNCSGCHAPGAPGKTAGTEETQDWSTRATAFTAWQGNASGLIGNFEGCNGVPFLGATAEESLAVAVFDETIRMNFSNASFPDCDSDSISDMTLKIGGPLPAGLLDDLKAWVNAGAPDM